MDGDEFTIDFFRKLGNENLTNDLYKNAEKCVYKLYGNNLLENVNDEYVQTSMLVTVETYDKKTYDRKSRPSNSKKIFNNPRKIGGKPKTI